MLLLDAENKTPLYLQLYQQLRSQILHGTLSPDSRLPTTRALAEEHGIGRNTVIRAYQQLELEGYVYVRPGSGHYVAAIDQPVAPCAPSAATDTRSRHIRRDSELSHPCQYDFQFGNLDYNCYRSHSWRRCLIDAFDQIALEPAVCYAESQGIYALREALCNYLRQSRGVLCTPEQLVITSGHQYSLMLIASLFDPAQWQFAMEEPGYRSSRLVFAGQGFQPVPVPLEQDGIELAAVQQLHRCLLYVTPSHQFPTGSVLPISKRLALLHWAARTDSYIIEDDYDSELRYHTSPVPSMQSLDRHDRTFYLGTFSKSMSPDLRMAYVVLPQQLVARYRQQYQHSNCAIPTFLQLALARFITEGEYDRHLQRLRTHCKRKHQYVVSQLERLTIPTLEITGTDAGLHLILSYRQGPPASEVVARLQQWGIRLYSLEGHWINQQACHPRQLMLGFSAIPLEQLPDAMNLLVDGLNTILSDGNIM